MIIINNKLISIDESDVVNGKLIIPNSVTHIGSGAFRNNQKIIQGNKVIQMIDGMATIVRSKKKVDDFNVFEGSFFNSKRKCFVANKGNYYAHGETLRQAIDDVNFKFLRENFNAEKLISEIKQKQKISLSEFRLLTGACSAGCEIFMREKGIKVTELPLDKALNMLNGQFGGEKIKNMFKK
ncbi:hypothetical protein CMT53_02670 [Elizabethkingia anophelis]|nr:hypothetical protein [Elizabethkingia anophelis]MDV3977915.1 hypothetical protein [Elizabethkingia anophelis]